MASDARADNDGRHGFRLVLSFGGTQLQGSVQSVSQAGTAAAGTMQYRVNIAAIGQDRKPELCSIVVASAAEAERYKNDLLNEHTTTLTCAVSHSVTTDPTAGAYVVLNTLSPAAGDSLTIESH